MKPFHSRRLLLAAHLAVVFCLLGPASFAQTTRISGTVTDQSTGDPLPGVNVVVDATQVGTITDLDGTYELALPTGNRTLLFTFLGYRTQEIDVPEGETVVNVQMEEDVLGLDEVVVTGLGTSVKRTNLANSVETISARELADITTNQTLDGAISGKVTGAVISSYTGAPGGGIAIKLRGISTINANSQPLFIVDGVVVSNASVQNGINVVTQAAAGGNASAQDNPVNRIADLNAEDIESIEILKGPSAAAIYGNGASNGVVVIKTKKGQAGRGTQVNVAQSIGFNTIQRTLGQPDYTLERALAVYAPPAGEDATPDEVAAAEAQQAFVTDLFNENGIVDLEDQLYGNEGLLSTTTLSVSGGNANTQFFLSGLVKDDEGIIENTGYQKQSLRANLDHRFNSRANLTVTSNYVRSVARRGITGNDNSGTSYGIALAGTAPFVDLTADAEGNFPNNPFNASNPLQTAALSRIGETTNRFISSGRFAYSILQNDRQTLQAIVEAGADFFALESQLLFPAELQFEPTDGLPGTSINGKTGNLNTNWRGILVHTYNLPANRIFFTTQAGFTGANVDRDIVQTVARGLIAGQQNVDQASSINVNETRFFQQDRAFFAQEEVNWDDKIVATVGLRADRSSLNGDVDQYFVYPKASLAANIAEFDFWTFDAVDQFKLRAAYGETGNTAPFGSRYTTFGPLAIGGVIGIAINNQRGFGEVEPERAREIEGGFDVSALDGRANLEFTVYQKNVENLLLTREVPNSSGFSFETFNGGELRNRGIEVGLTVLPVNNDAFRWVSRTSFWTNAAEVTELTVPAFRAIGGGFGATLGEIRIEEGESPTQIVGVDDIDGDGTSDGVFQLGDTAPDFQMSFTQDITFFEDFSLIVFAHWKKGGDNLNLTELLTDLGGTSPDYFDDDDGDGVTNAAERVGALGVSARQFVQDASYFRIREIGLYYNIPSRYFQSAFGYAPRNVRIGVSANNPITITPYKSYDPEVNNFADQPVASGVEVTPFPTSRSFLFHVSVGL